VVAKPSYDCEYEHVPSARMWFFVRSRRSSRCSHVDPTASSYSTVLLRAVCGCLEPGLTPRQSIQWAAYVVVMALAPIARSHPEPGVGPGKDARQRHVM
jgi:hypothetical protein